MYRYLNFNNTFTTNHLYYMNICLIRATVEWNIKIFNLNQCFKHKIYTDIKDIKEEMGLIIGIKLIDHIDIKININAF